MSDIKYVDVMLKLMLDAVFWSKRESDSKFDFGIEGGYANATFDVVSNNRQFIFDLVQRENVVVYMHDYSELLDVITDSMAVFGTELFSCHDNVRSYHCTRKESPYKYFSTMNDGDYKIWAAVLRGKAVSPESTDRKDMSYGGLRKFIYEIELMQDNGSVYIDATSSRYNCATDKLSTEEVVSQLGGNYIHRGENDVGGLVPDMVVRSSNSSLIQGDNTTPNVDNIRALLNSDLCIDDKLKRITDALNRMGSDLLLQFNKELEHAVEKPTSGDKGIFEKIGQIMSGE